MLKIVTSLPHGTGMMNMVPRKDFKKLLKKEFRTHDKNLLYDSLVFSQSNKEIFPIFFETNGKILISISHTKLLSILYLSIFYKNLFDKERRRISDIFEKDDVPAELEKNSFKTKKNITDKKKSSLEIDTLTWRSHSLYVVETKIWDIRPFFEYKNVHQYQERDLKGIVDGFKYTTKDGKLEKKKIPSLKSKIEFIKNNLARFCPEHEEIKEVKGLVITKRYPPIKKYKGVKFISFSEIKKL